MNKFIKTILLIEMILVSGCAAENNKYYYSLSEIFELIENNPDEIESTKNAPIYTNFKGELSEISIHNMSFSIKEGIVELKCFFDNDAKATVFFEKYHVGETVRLSGEIIKNDMIYQAVITDFK